MQTVPIKVSVISNPLLTVEIGSMKKKIRLILNSIYIFLQMREWEVQRSLIRQNPSHGISFSVSPAEYKVVYDGNGGSSVPAGLNCKYDETAVYPAAPGNSPGYTITVNTNGAEGMVSPVTAFRSFLNWGDAGAVPGAAFRNLTTKMGQLLQNMRTGARQQFIRCLRSCIGNIQLPTIQTEEIANRL